MIRFSLDKENIPRITWGENDQDSETISIYVNPTGEEAYSREKSISWGQYASLSGLFDDLKIKFLIDESIRSVGQLRTKWAKKIISKVPRDQVSKKTTILKRTRLALRKPQENALKSLFSNYLNLLAAVCGTGKTLIILLYADIIKRATGRVKLFVVAPKSVCAEFDKELQRISEHTDLSMINLADLPTNMQGYALENSHADVIVLQLESVHKHTNRIREIVTKAKDSSILCVDEGHYIKNMGSLRFKAVDAIAPFFSNMLISTATPTPYDMSDLRAYLNTVYRSASREAYKYEIPVEDFAVIRDISFVSLEDDLEYGPLSESNIYFASNEDRFKQMEAIVRKEKSKGRKVLIFCATNETMKLSYDYLKKFSKMVLSGSYYTESPLAHELLPGNSKEFRQKAISIFNSADACDVLIANYKVGSTGLNLQHSGARLALFLEITNNGADFFQSRYRIRRPLVSLKLGFEYIYFINDTYKNRRNVTKQFAKLEQQMTLLENLRSHSKSRGKSKKV